MSEKSRHFVFFSILFVACILGSIAIFVFAVGMETGNNIVNDTMTMLIRNSIWVLLLFGTFNACVWLIYRQQRRKLMAKKG